MAAGCAARITLWVIWPLCFIGLACAAEFTLLGGQADCDADCFEPESARLIALTPETIDRALAAGPWSGNAEARNHLPGNSTHLKTLIGMVLGHLAARHGSLPISASDFAREFESLCLSRSGADVTDQVARLGISGYQRQYPNDPVILIGDDFRQQITADGWMALLDLLEVKVPNTDNKAPPWPKALLDRISSLKATNAANVVLITAGGGEALGQANAGLRTLAASGGSFKTVWWPLDRVLSEALHSSDCSALAARRSALTGRYQREVLYPAEAAAQVEACSDPGRLSALLQTADVIVIDDGKTEFFRKALDLDHSPLPPWSEALRRAIQSGTPVIAAGTGAEILGRRYAVTAADQHLTTGSGEILCAVPGCEHWRFAPGLNAVGLDLILGRAAEQSREWILIDAASRGAQGIGAALDAGSLLQGRTGIDDPRLEAGGDGAVLLADYQRATWSTTADSAALEHLTMARLTAGAGLVLNQEMGSGQAILPAKIDPPASITAAAVSELQPGDDLSAPGHFRAWLQSLLAYRLQQGELEIHNQGRHYRLVLSRKSDAGKATGMNGLIAAGGIQFESWIHRDGQ